MYIHTVGINIFHILKDTSPVLTKLHNIADIFRRCIDMCIGHWFFGFGNQSRVGIIGRVVDGLCFSVRCGDFKDNTRCSRNQIQVIFTFQTFLYNFHMKQSKKSASETESQRNRCFRFIGQRSIIQLKFFQCITQIRIFSTVCGINAAEHHRLNRTVTGQRFFCGIRYNGHSITYTCITDSFDRCGNITHLTCIESFCGFQCCCTQKSTFNHRKFRTRCHQANGIAYFQLAFFQPHINDNTLIAVIVRVKNQRLQRFTVIPLRRRHQLHDLFHHVMNVNTDFRRNTRRILCRQADDIFNFLFDPFRIGTRQINFVDDRHNFQSGIQC